MRNILLLTVIGLISFTLAACNPEKIDEAVKNNDNPEVSRLVNDDNKENTDNSDHQTEGRLNVADELAEQVNSLEEIKESWVFITEKNAFVAVVLNDEGTENIPEEVKRKVAEEVKASDRTVENVYVSSNPDFAERFHDIAVRVEEGEPIEGLVEEFNQTVQRLFPDIL